MKNLKIAATALFLLGYTLAFGQSNYSRGFKVGYVNGACAELAANCNVSIPDVKVKFGKFRDGYATGFEKGLTERKDVDKKAYFREYTHIREDISNPNVTIADADLINKVLQKTEHYYISGDYEKCISLSDLLARYLSNDYRTNMFKGLSLLELEDFKQGRNFLRWALRDVNDIEQRQKIQTIIDEVENGTYKNNKLRYEAAITGTKMADLPPLPAPVLPMAKEQSTPKESVAVTKPLNSSGKLIESGDAKFKKGDYAGAVADYTLAINLEPGPDAYYKRAVAKQELQDYYGATNDYKAIISSDKKTDFAYIGDVYMNYSTILIKQKKYSEAIPFLTNIISKGGSPKLAPALYYRGIAKINSGDKDGGCTDLSKSGELGYKDAYDEIKKNCQ